MLDKSDFPTFCPLHTTGAGPCYCGKVNHDTGGRIADTNQLLGSYVDRIPDVVLFLEDRAAYVGKRYGDRLFYWNIQGFRLRDLVEQISEAIREEQEGK